MKIIGHRGVKGLAPENTLAALKKGLECGVDALEFDVSVSSDDVPFLQHNDKLTIEFALGRYWKRTPTSSYIEMKHQKPSTTTLQEALDFAYGKTTVFVEIEPAQPVESIFKILDKYLKPKDKSILVGSFDFKILKAARRCFPGVNLFVVEPWSGLRATYRARQLHTDFIVMDKRFLWSVFVSSMSKRGYKLIAYTNNYPAKVSRWARLGLYGVVTDFPDRFTNFLGER